MILTGCRKSCLIETTVVPVFKCTNPELVRSIQINFYQGTRVVGADIIRDFKVLEYKFYDTDPDLMVWRVYHVDRTWVEYRTRIE